MLGFPKAGENLGSGHDHYLKYHHTYLNKGAYFRLIITFLAPNTRVEILSLTP